jgi:hypothetical protein
MWQSSLCHDNNGSDGFDDGFNVDITDPNDEHVLYYDWSANSTTTAHMTNQHEAFTTYHLAIPSCPLTPLENST